MTCISSIRRYRTHVLGYGVFCIVVPNICMLLYFSIMLSKIELNCGNAG